MAKLKYKRSKGKRIKRYGFDGITTYDRFNWSEEYQRWVPFGGDLGKEGAGTHFDDCFSVRAFRRRLREYSSYLPPGIEFELVSIYQKCDVLGRTIPTKRSS